MSTMTRKGRKPTNFYRGRIPNANLKFIYNLKGEHPRIIQKAYHNKYKVWLRESTIESTLKRYTPMKKEVRTTNNSNENSNISIHINYNGRGYTLKQYTELIRVDERKKIANQLANG